MGQIITVENSAERNGINRRHRSQLTTIPFETAIELQQLILAAARQAETTASALAQLARAWSDLERTKRVIKMKPDPKPVDVASWRIKPRQLKAAAEFQEQPAAKPDPKPNGQ